MNTKIIFLLLLFFTLPDLYAQSPRKGLALETGIIFNVSDLDWSIAGNLDGHSPNILSELKFNTIASLGYYLSGHYTPVKYLKFSGYFQQNNVINGEGSDTDYQDDNRTNPVFEKKFVSDKGDLMALKGGIGTPIPLSSRVSITPSLLYSLTKQKFYLESHEMQALRSTYQATMQGMEVSVEGTVQLSKIIYSSLTLSYHFVNYKAEADWNLIDIFKHPVSFSQTSKGSGPGVNVTVGGNINKMFSIVASGALNATTIREGIDTAYLITEKNISTQFNGANNILYDLRVGIRIFIGGTKD